MVLKLGRVGQQIRNTWKVLKCGAGEGWRRSVGPIMWEMKKGYFRVSERRNILHEIRKRKANGIGHILRRNCLLKQVIEGKIKREMEVTRRRGRRRKKLLDDLKDRRGYSHLKEEALDRTMWRNRFGGGFGPVFRQNTEWMNECFTLPRLYREYDLIYESSFRLMSFFVLLPNHWTFPAEFHDVCICRS